MSVTIMAYGEAGYQEFVLPALVDSNCSITLKKEIFGLLEDVSMPLEVVDNEWKFLPSGQYHILTQNRENGFGVPLRDGMALSVRGNARLRLTLICFFCRERFPVYRKYHMPDSGLILIGKGEGCAIQYDFCGYISRNHAALLFCGGRWILSDRSKNGTYLNGRRVKGQQELSFGDHIALFGLRILFLGELLAIGTLSGEYRIGGGRLLEYALPEGERIPERREEAPSREFFKRAPRVIEKPDTEPVEIEPPPALNTRKKRPLPLTIGSSFTMVIPMLLGCLMAIISARVQGSNSGVYMFTGLVTAVSSAVIGVMWALISLKYEKREEKEKEELRYSSYGQYLTEITEEIRRKYEANRAALFCTYLSGEECCRFTQNDVRLWNHNSRQQDFMYVRIGTGTVPFQAQIRIPKKKFMLIRDDLALKPALIRDTYRYLYSVPVCMDVQSKGLIGLIGGAKKAGAYPVAYNMIAQLAANICYTDVKFVFIYRGGRESAARWGFARWLPHVWMEDKKTRLIASNPSEVGDILYELSGMLRKRTEDSGREAYPLPHYVLFVDDPELLQGELLENDIYDPKPEYGMTTVLLVERYADLPNSCETIIRNDGGAAEFFHVSNEEERSRDLVMETVSSDGLETLARNLCGVKVNEVCGSGEIPASLDFFELYGARSLEQLNILDRWKKNRTYESMRAPIGKKAGGICYLDIHEKYHGPHGLVAGTTGSGKSETLQTYILSLAVNFSPDDVAFFLIDFKGGGMANLFSGLPHMAGQISNLSGTQVRRAMISIKSENRRRQRIFAENSVNNINAYTMLYKSHEVKTPIPHLFIIIDEFAELKREEPEFMKELISVAQVGRSLGVHLILATQKPSGTVDDNIWSNSKFRLCLRVQDKQDSNDMLRKPDAAYITQAGRGYLQVGNDEIYEQFQSGYSGAAYVSDPRRNKSPAAVLLSLTGRQELAGGRLCRKQMGDEKEISQLDAVVGHLRDIAGRYHYDSRMLLWLPVLPETLYLEELEGYREELMRAREGAWKLEAMVGLYDDPVNQAQKPFAVSFSDGGHLAVCGTVSVGKSTFLQTLLYALIQKYNPQELNFYILDYSNRLLLPFEKAPHCGGVVVDTDGDKVQKFFYLAGQLMEERKRMFRGGNYSQYIQHCRAKHTPKSGQLPAVVIAIDNYSNFRDKTGGRFDEIMQRLAREGTGYGIFLAITASGFGASELPAKVGDSIRTVISLEMGDKFKYAEVLRTPRVENVPETNVKGRGIAWVNGAVLEFQTALAFPAENLYQMSEQLERYGEELTEKWDGAGAKRIPIIPENPVFSEFIVQEEYRAAEANPRILPFAYASEDASVYGVDLWNTYCYLIQGRNRSGRKNVMKLLLYAASRKEHAKTVVIDLKGQELRTFAGQIGAQYLDTEQGVYEFWKGTIPVFKERNSRKRLLMERGEDAETIARMLGGEEPYFIFIADLAAFLRAVYSPQPGMGSMNAYLENITERGSSHGFYFFAILGVEQAGSVAGYTLYQNMASYRTGIHLGGNISGQRLFQFQNIPFREQSKAQKPGTGYVPGREDPACADVVVLPLVKGGKRSGAGRESCGKEENP